MIENIGRICREVDGQGGAYGVLFLDLSKALDTFDHGRFLLKLRHLGFKMSSVGLGNIYRIVLKLPELLDIYLGHIGEQWCAPGFYLGAATVYLLY